MYSVIGFGMALPYLVLGAFPELLRFLPKPGAWMETFKKTMGFCLLLAVVWILYFVPVEKLLPTVALLFALWFICWSFGEQQLVGRAHKRTYIISPIVLGLAIVLSFQIPSIPNPYTLESAMQARLERREAKGFTEGRIIGKEEGLAEGEMKGKAEMAQNLLHLDAQLSTLIKEAMGDLLSVEMASPRHHGEHWKPYSDAALESALSSGKVVIIDFTADWCVNCKVLAATVFQTETTLTLLEDKQIVSLEADCTRDGEARNLLLRLGPELVPTLAIFDPAEPSKPTMIRGGYTQKTLTERLGGK
jgi:thiol:disulfide interchange protein DsbD